MANFISNGAYVKNFFSNAKQVVKMYSYGFIVWEVVKTDVTTQVYIGWDNEILQAASTAYVHLEMVAGQSVYIDWGDGYNQTFLGGLTYHKYKNAGYYNIRIVGRIKTLYSNYVWAVIGNVQRVLSKTIGTELTSHPF